MGLGSHLILELVREFLLVRLSALAHHLEVCACYGQDEKGLPPTPDTLNLGCSYHLHSSHRFLSTWGAVTMLEKKKKVKYTSVLYILHIDRHSSMLNLT